MTGCRLRITTLLLLLAVVVCSFSVGSVEIEPASKRMLRENNVASENQHEQHSNTEMGFVNAAKTEKNKATGSAGSAHEAPGSAHEKPKEESLFMSFVGPALAGVLAIALIGAVIAFKNRKGK